MWVSSGWHIVILVYCHPSRYAIHYTTHSFDVMFVNDVIFVIDGQHNGSYVTKVNIPSRINNWTVSTDCCDELRMPHSVEIKFKSHLSIAIDWPKRNGNFNWIDWQEILRFCLQRIFKYSAPRRDFFFNFVDSDQTNFRVKARFSISAELESFFCLKALNHD